MNCNIYKAHFTHKLKYRQDVGKQAWASVFLSFCWKRVMLCICLWIPESGKGPIPVTGQASSRNMERIADRSQAWSSCTGRQEILYFVRRVELNHSWVINDGTTPLCYLSEYTLPLTNDVWYASWKWNLNEYSFSNQWCRIPSVLETMWLELSSIYTTHLWLAHVLNTTEYWNECTLPITIEVPYLKAIGHFR